MLPAMDGKETGSNNPVVVIQPSQETKKISSAKKYVIIGVISIILLGILLTGILVGMHIFTQAQKDLMEFTMNLYDGRKQDVTSDVANNVVKYHVKDDDQESCIVSDFNKIPTDFRSVVYQIADDPITDISFLNKDGRDMCKGVSTYWLYPSCENNNAVKPSNNTKTQNKRQQNGCFYVYGWDGMACSCGCRTEVCSCAVYYECTQTDGTQRCRFYYATGCRYTVTFNVNCPYH